MIQTPSEYNNKLMERITTETPDKWIVLKLPNNMHKVFASWVGEYLHRESWKLNSGIESVEQEGDYYYFTGYSGSVYKCHKDAYGTTGYGSLVLNDILQRALKSDVVVEILPNSENWESLTSPK